MISDGTNTYLWDADNRLVQINYSGTGNNTKFLYDGFNRCMRIVETISGASAANVQFVWDSYARTEARNNSGTLISQYFPFGFMPGGTPYYYSIDHLNSVREVTDATGSTQSEYNYTSFGDPSIVQNNIPSDFGYASYYMHSRSGLCLTPNRSYAARLGIWTSRDPIDDFEQNLYSYASGNPILLSDSLGLEPLPPNTGGQVSPPIPLIGGYTLPTGPPNSNIGLPYIERKHGPNSSYNNNKPVDSKFSPGAWSQLVPLLNSAIVAGIPTQQGNCTKYEIPVTPNQWCPSCPHEPVGWVSPFPPNFVGPVLPYPADGIRVIIFNPPDRRVQNSYPILKGVTQNVTY